MNQRFEEAKTIYKKLGIDVDEALKQLQTFPVSMHCWQGDDVVGFDGAGALSGGIQTTGNYPGKARNYQENLPYRISNEPTIVNFSPAKKKLLTAGLSVN